MAPKKILTVRSTLGDGRMNGMENRILYHVMPEAGARKNTGKFGIYLCLQELIYLETFLLQLSYILGVFTENYYSKPLQ